MSAPGTTPGPWSVDPTNGDIVSGAVNVSIPYATKAEDRILMAASQRLYDALDEERLHFETDISSAISPNFKKRLVARHERICAALAVARGDAS